MSGNVTTQKQVLHDLVDRLVPVQIAAARNLLEAMVDPVGHAVAHAPVDPDPLSQDEIAALKEAKEWLARNPAIPHEQVLAELGITMEEIEEHKDCA
ncbi:MAG: hypothetical protein U0R19_26550 [Bryobacteraceae bacterium]